jgi:NTP pyrophosphatase (non-canonical NTP hydrolase)
MLDLNNMNEEEIIISEGMDALIDLCHGAAVDGGWWNDSITGKPIHRESGTLFMLMVSEISEAMEADRKDLMDDKLHHRKGVEVELADAIIRICDYAGYHDLDLSGAILEKIEYNARRADHKPENRLKEGGKKY